MVKRKRNKRNRVIKRISFLLLVIISFFLSSMAGFKIAEQSSKIQQKKIASTNASVVSKDSADDSTNSDKTAQDKKTNEEKEDKSQQNESEEPLPEDAKVAYLTFDDGPSRNVTPKILDILKKNNIKATFFVIGSSVKANPDLLKREEKDGHTIGNHTYTHDYNYLYSNIDNFLNDLDRNEKVIDSVIDHHDKTLIRFPGGSFGRTAYQRAAENAGYHYIDWNVLNGDAEVSHSSADRLISRFKQTFLGQKKIVVLMHDAATKETTAEALPTIINILKQDGYEFRPITSDSYNILK